MSKIIKIVEGKMFKLDPSKKYIMIFGRDELTQEDVYGANKHLKKMGIDGISFLIADPNDFKIIEQPQKLPPDSDTQYTGACPCLTCSGYCACKIKGHHDQPKKSQES